VSKSVLIIENRHVKVPPLVLHNLPDFYTGYFENEYGEQLVFAFDLKRNVGLLWHGDNDWEATVVQETGLTSLILSQEERDWLGIVNDVARKRFAQRNVATTTS
jgi:hypothetical protein